MANPFLSHYPDIGVLGEDIVTNWLQSLGYQVLHRRWRCRYGELDLIAQQSSLNQTIQANPSRRIDFNQPSVANLSSLIFVEVKTRSRGNWDEDGLLAITLSKQKKLWCAAEMFLTQYPDLAEIPCRFDVALVSCQKLPKRLKDDKSDASLLTDKVITSVEINQPIKIAGYRLILHKYIQSAFEGFTY